MFVSDRSVSVSTLKDFCGEVFFLASTYQLKDELIIPAEDDD